MTTQVVYRMYGTDGLHTRLLYVGVSLNAQRRLAQHATKAWFNEVTTIHVDHFPTRTEALAEEARAIAYERPAYNAHGRVAS